MPGLSMIFEVLAALGSVDICATERENACDFVSFLNGIWCLWRSGCRRYVRNRDRERAFFGQLSQLLEGAGMCMTETEKT